MWVRGTKEVSRVGAVGGEGPRFYGGREASGTGDPPGNAQRNLAGVPSVSGHGAGGVDDDPFLSSDSSFAGGYGKCEAGDAWSAIAEPDGGSGGCAGPVDEGAGIAHEGFRAKGEGYVAIGGVGES